MAEPKRVTVDGIEWEFRYGAWMPMALPYATVWRMRTGLKRWMLSGHLYWTRRGAMRAYARRRETR